MRRLGVGNWVELIAGPVPATVFYGVPTSLMLVVGVRSLMDTWPNPYGAVGMVALCVTALACLAAFWLVVLMGPGWVKGTAWLRGLCILLGVIGVGMTFFLLVQAVQKPADPWSALILGGPLVVGTRYLLALLRRSEK